MKTLGNLTHEQLDTLGIIDTTWQSLSTKDD